MPTYQARTAGIYRARYVGCSEKTFTDEQTGEDQQRYLWRFQEINDPLTTGEISKWTSTNMQNANANAHKIAAGIMGRKLQPGDDTETMVGELYDVVYGPNQAGNLTITSVVKVNEEAAVTPPLQGTAAAPSQAPAAVVPPTVAPEPAALPELP